jgi:transposase-like protein
MQIASDFGIAESCLRNWMRGADVEDGNRPGGSASESAELPDARRRIRLLEQENEVLRGATRASSPESRHQVGRWDCPS